MDIMTHAVLVCCYPDSDLRHHLWCEEDIVLKHCGQDAYTSHRVCIFLGPCCFTAVLSDLLMYKRLCFPHQWLHLCWAKCQRHTLVHQASWCRGWIKVGCQRIQYTCEVLMQWLQEDLCQLFCNISWMQVCLKVGKTQHHIRQRLAVRLKLVGEDYERLQQLQKLFYLGPVMLRAQPKISSLLASDS